LAAPVGVVAARLRQNWLMPVAVSIEPPRQPEVLELLRLSDEFALGLYPADSCYMLDLGELEAPGVTVFVARDAGAGDASAADAGAGDSASVGTALGIVALVDRGDGSAELKRMFLHESARGRGMAGELMWALEVHARASGISVIQLETGPKQPAAVALYERHGYVHIANFGQYIGDEFSVCMEKRLTR
jgi:putative acetyltransferase